MSSVGATYDLTDLNTKELHEATPISRMNNAGFECRGSGSNASLSVKGVSAARKKRKLTHEQESLLRGKRGVVKRQPNNTWPTIGLAIGGGRVERLENQVPEDKICLIRSVRNHRGINAKLFE